MPIGQQPHNIDTKVGVARRDALQRRNLLPRLPRSGTGINASMITNAAARCDSAASRTATLAAFDGSDPLSERFEELCKLWRQLCGEGWRNHERDISGRLASLRVVGLQSVENTDDLGRVRRLGRDTRQVGSRGPRRVLDHAVAVQPERLGRIEIVSLAQLDKPS